MPSLKPRRITWRGHDSDAEALAGERLKARNNANRYGHDRNNRNKHIGHDDEHFKNDNAANNSGSANANVDVNENANRSEAHAEEYRSPERWDIGDVLEAVCKRVTI